MGQRPAVAPQRDPRQRRAHRRLPPAYVARKPCATADSDQSAAVRQKWTICIPPPEQPARQTPAQNRRSEFLPERWKRLHGDRRKAVRAWVSIPAVYRPACRFSISRLGSRDCHLLCLDSFGVSGAASCVIRLRAGQPPPGASVSSTQVRLVSLPAMNCLSWRRFGSLLPRLWARAGW